MTQQLNRTTTLDREHALSSLPMTLQQSSPLSEQAQPFQDLDARAAKHVLRTLLVPLDGTPHAEHALPHAIAIARRSGARIRLVRVHASLAHVAPWHMHSVYEWNDREKRDEYNYLLDLAARIESLSSVTVDVRLTDNVDTVASLATESAHADLVVMASRRRGFLRRLFSPSIAHALRRRMQTPGLFVQGYAYPVDLTGDPVARHILIPLDGAEVAERILGVATTVSKLEGAKLSLVNVQNNDWSLGAFAHTTPSSYLMGVARNVRRSGPQVDAHVVTTERSIAKAIASFAKRRDVDVIALATHSDGDWTQVLERNIADALIRETNLPILLLGVGDQRKRAEVTTIFES